MIPLRTLFALFFLALGLSTSQAKGRPKPMTTAQAEARNEAAAPSFSGRIRDAHRVTNYLGDALQLDYAQWHALTACTVMERETLALALTHADTLSAERQYLELVRRALATSQMETYVLLRQQLAGTLLPLDGTEVALR